MFFYLPTLQSGKITAPLSNHFISMRVKKGENIQITDFNGNIADAEVINVDTKNKVIDVTLIHIKRVPSTKKGTLVQSLLDKQYMEKFFEIIPLTFFETIVLFFSDYSLKYNPNEERWESILKRSGQQSHSAWLPKLVFMKGGFENVFESVGLGNLMITPEQNRKYSLSTSFQKESEETSVSGGIEIDNPILYVGCEGGWSEREVSLAEAKMLKFMVWEHIVFPSWIAGYTWSFSQKINNKTQ